MSILDLDRLGAAPLNRDPFDFILVRDFVRGEELPALIADFPAISRPGSFPADALDYGPAFARLLRELADMPLRRAIAAKFAIDLEDRPTMVTVRGRGDGKDGRIHTDSASKIITLLIYMNAVWERPEGRLRVLRSAEDIEDFAVEVPPLAGTMLAFRRGRASFHGHLPYRGERRVVQLNWVTDAAVVRREAARHRWSARWKALSPFA